MPTAPEFQDVLLRLADRNRVRSEATIQADIRQLLLTGGLDLSGHDLQVDLESGVGDRRRIDIEVGFTVIEVKKDLRRTSVLQHAERQLSGYVADRTQEVGQPYVGILTDGTYWRAYRQHAAELHLASEHEISANRPDANALISWLEGALSTQRNIPPTPDEIAKRLGASSLSYALDKSLLAALYAENRNEPTVQLKRHLWARLLRSALGTQFEDNDDLFIEHTLLVNSAEIIAHLVLGLPVSDMQPATILRGQRFDQAQLYGVVEADFFDWVIEVPQGTEFVRGLARRLSRFNWTLVEHDVLKVLYESVIGTETRKRLGEYYTPDWLAERVVQEVVTDPLEQKVLDPACGSGTFLFHAVRRFLSAAESEGQPLKATLDKLSRYVVGIDLHPVAVALARVTYVLAIGTERLTSPERGAINIPVYLGDSVQWTQRQDLFDQDQLVIRTGAGGQLFEDELRFPSRILSDAGRFDRLVSELADLAVRPRASGTVPSLTALFNRLAIDEGDKAEVRQNFELLCRLVDEGRNHIWSYYVRNLARPMWLSRLENRVDVMVGNPPWLSYRHMPEDMQEKFKQMSRSWGLWQGAEVATHQDLSGLFVVRSVQQYLKRGGRFGFVLPNAVLDRGYWDGFRSGRYLDTIEPAGVAFEGSWDLRRIRPHFFPRGGAVVFGTRTTENQAKRLSKETVRFTGQLPRAGVGNWDQAVNYLSTTPAALSLAKADLLDSPYKSRFSQGATIVPRVLFFVHSTSNSPLGLGSGRIAVRSERSSTEKMPWKSLPAMEGIVETEFVRPILLGESVLPYRVLSPRTAILPLEGRSILHGKHPHIDLYPGLAEWWRNAEHHWEENRSTDRLTLTEQLDFRSKLTAQLPGTPLRLIYGKSGMHVAAAITDVPHAIIDHLLYWGTVSTWEEGWYLCAILNTPRATELVRPFMSYGKDERHIDKHLWKLPIPIYNSDIAEHRRLAELGAAEARLIASLDVPESANFVTLRRTARDMLAKSEHADELDELVTELLDQ